MGDRKIRVKVPATSANLGPGFDTLGVSLGIYNELELSLNDTGRVVVNITGEGAGRLYADERNVVWQAVMYLLKKAGGSETYTGGVLNMENNVPLTRGLGSSAAAIVAGIKAANVLMGNRFNRREILQLATEIEGHPDNVAPAVFGGFTVSLMGQGKAECFSFVPRLRLRLVVAVPDFELSTKKAREALPCEVPLADAVFNISRASMMVAALCRGNEYFLRHSFDDALHQPFRAELVPGMYDVFKAARQRGAIGAALSGAGPSILAFTLERDHVEASVGEAMVAAFESHGQKAYYLAPDIDTRGAHIVNNW